MFAKVAGLMEALYLKPRRISEDVRKQRREMMKTVNKSQN